MKNKLPWIVLIAAIIFCSPAKAQQKYRTTLFEDQVYMFIHINIMSIVGLRIQRWHQGYHAYQ